MQPADCTATVKNNNKQVANLKQTDFALERGGTIFHWTCTYTGFSIHRQERGRKQKHLSLFTISEFMQGCLPLKVFPFNLT